MTSKKKKKTQEICLQNRNIFFQEYYINLKLKFRITTISINYLFDKYNIRHHPIYKSTQKYHLHVHLSYLHLFVCEKIDSAR